MHLQQIKKSITLTSAKTIDSRHIAYAIMILLAQFIIYFLWGEFIMNEKDLILIKTLFEEKNITHTSKRLFLSQPAISDRLRRLENELNCNLIIRQPRGILFTSEGEQLYEYACQHLKDYNTLKESLNNKKNLTSGILRLGCSNMFSKHKMPHILSEFQKNYPDIEIHMQSGYSHDRYKDFLESKIHVCIVRGNHNWNEHRTLLFKEPLCLISKHTLDFKLLPSLPYIHYKTDPLLQAVLDEWWYSNFKESPKMYIEVDDMTTALKLVQENLGYTFLSQMCLLDMPNLCAEPLRTTDNVPIERSTWMFYRNNYEHFTATKAFIDFMNEKFNIN